jgi:DNA-binding MarR family transcriptional regulator
MTNEIAESLHEALDDLLLLHIACDKHILARHELRRVRFYMLRHLYQNPGISFSRLSELSFTDGASTSRMVYSMEKEGLVQRQSNESDRRLSALSLTDAGKAKYEEASSELRVDIHARFSSIDPDVLPGILHSTLALSAALLQHQENRE